MAFLTRRLFNEINFFSKSSSELVNASDETSNHDVVLKSLPYIKSVQAHEEYTKITDSNKEYLIGVIKPSTILGQCLLGLQESKAQRLSYVFDYSLFGNTDDALFFLIPDNKLTVNGIHAQSRAVKDSLLETYLLGIPVEQFLNSITDERVIDWGKLQEILKHEPLV